MSTGEPVPSEPLVGFKHHLRVDTLPGQAVFLTSSRDVLAVRGGGAETLAPLLDGTRTVADVVLAAGPALDAARARRGLAQLDRAGLLSAALPGTPRRSPAERAYWDLAEVPGTAAEGSPAVAVTVCGSADPEEIRLRCRAAGLSVADPDSEAVLGLVFCDDYLDPRLTEIQVRERCAGRPWLLAGVNGPDLWIGPFFGVDNGPCHSCLAHRYQGHRRGELPLRDALGLAGPVPVPRASLPTSRETGIQLALLEANKWLAGHRHPGQRAVYVLDTLTLRAEHHPVRRRPQCPDCGDPGRVAAANRRPVRIESRPKAVTTGTGHRSASAEQMLAAYADLVDPITGIVAELRRDTRAPDFLHCYLAGQNLALPTVGLGALTSNLRTLSGGKGSTDAQARMSALGEAVERHCGTRQGDEAVVLDSFAGLGEQAIHPNDCQLFAPRQFRDRARSNARHSHFHHVPAPFDEKAETAWTPVWSLVDGRHRLLPTGLLYYSDGTAGSGANRLLADSNGCAAGTSLEDALLQGFLELVERDAVAVWWYNRLRRPAVDLDAFDDPWFARMRTGLAALRREVWALDLTSDLGIPCVAALSRRTDGAREDIVFGFGAHFDARVAVVRALCEMGQLLPAVLGARPDGTGYAVDDPAAVAWWSRATTANQPYLRPDPGQTPRSPSDFRHVLRHDLAHDVDAVVSLMSSSGHDLLVLDQTRPDVGLPVVRVLAPGLRHFWARFAPGRLFDVPVRLGIRERPTLYEDLNPIPMFV
ncbi:TOMM precursor leader peptide-binding protein [Streptomyces canus]|uniref:TOMM precursor leader peptide-binding protein n=1 Tax=Streptomyces canus TaxID=58343 RepID=UPI002250ADA0|nr:TOMM precursor leader peptide-binding protein [Streptomyces canus]MCX4856305.1 TOMM precursor leader peptide-binding protein [Streptomyces canus]WSW38227.1 TOMM precursor leader peptide-binding protein [Streptomyces canus]